MNDVNPYNINVYHTFGKRVYDIWSDLYNRSVAPSPFSDPEAIRISLKYFFPYYFRTMRKPEIVVLTKQDNPVFAMVILKPIWGKGRLEMFADTNGIGICSPVYLPNVSLDECLRLIRCYYGEEITFSRVVDDCELAKHVSKVTSSTPCVAIDFKQGYDSWYSSLSKSVRQNIRTAYNRLITDEKKSKLIVVDNKSSYVKYKKRLIQLYSSRHHEHYGVSTPGWKKWFLQHLSFATKMYEICGNAFTLIVEIDGEPAAFMSGLNSIEGRFVVPRLSMDNVYRRYSPGIMLINETIRYFDEKKISNILDLTIGQEKYKYDSGGKTYTQLKGVL